MAARDTLLITALLLTSLLAAPAASAATPSFAWGSDLSQWWSYGPERTAALEAAKATGMNLIVTDAKDAGLIGWATPSYPGFTTFPSGDGAVERVTRDAHAQGLRVAARFDVFQDLNAAKIYPGAVIGGNPAWVDPACAEVRAYSMAQLKDLLTRVPVDEINLDHIRYPGVDEVAGSTRLPCTGSTLSDVSHADRSAIITSWVQEAAAAARAIRPGIVVSISVFGYTMEGAMPSIGQDAARLAPHVDVLRPMLYPSYYSAAAASQPYATVKDATTKGIQKFGAAKIQPWIQGFDAYAGRADLVCEQYKALRDAGATGGLVWWFPSTGTSTTFWSAVAACVPASGTTGTTTSPTSPSPSTGGSTAPSPSNATFEAAFAPKAGAKRWVETTVTSSQAIAGVSVSVNGATPIALSQTGASTWGKSIRVPSGATLRFVATATSGATATSALYAWPSAEPVQPAPAPAPAPAPSTFTATFSKGGANSWWVEAWVSGNAPIASVTASVNGGAPVPLSATSWGSWAKSFFVPDGSKVVFTATSTTGQTATSGAFAWP